MAPVIDRLLGQEKLSRYILILLSLFLLLATAGCGGGGGSSPANTTTVTLSGSVLVPSGVTIDSDVNDPNETYIANDSLATAQALPNPISLGGYVNVAGTGASGRSFAGGDADDYFQVQCNTGDTISLTIADYTAADLDLSLYESDGTPVAESIGTGQSELVTAPATDTYIARVNAKSGASNYILAIGLSSIAGIGSKVGTLSTQYEFVPGQVVVHFKKSARTAGPIQRPSDRAAAMGMALAAGAADREMLMTFDDTDPQTTVGQALGITKGWSREEIAHDPTLERKINTLRVIKALRQRNDILYAEPNYILHPYTIPDDPLYGLQWNFPQINLPLAWDYTTGDINVIVAVIDTGVLMNHPDLSDHLTSTGYDFVSQVSMSNDGDGIDADPEDPGDSGPGANSFHGTHCAGLVAAETDNLTGVAGVGWNTRIMPVRVLGVGGGTSYDVRQGIRYAAGLNNDSGITLDASQRADIISLSLGSEGYDATTQGVIDDARTNGVIIIAAAGNDSSSTPTYPASYDGVISVSAVNINGTLASYSNYGSYIDVAAPGGDAGDSNGDGYQDLVWSTCGDDSSGSIIYNYQSMAGTSMATPHVAGVVALMKALAPALTPADLDALLASGAITSDIGTVGRDNYYGYGLIDAFKAVAAAGSNSIPTVLNASPTLVNLGTSSIGATVTISKIGTDPISVNPDDVSDDADWLTVTSTAIDGEGLGTYTLHADRTGLSDGSYAATVTFPSSENPVTIQVNLQVSSAVAEYNAGYHYVLLIDADDNSILAQDEVQAAGGIYSYSFSQVPRGGTYFIVAGSDRDNDYYIDNPGESVGAYPTLDQISTVEATDNMSGLDFFTNLTLSISTTGLDAEEDEALPQFMRLH
ncbi:MAG: S8 family peptidase [Deltaproteobacteria bacterium]|nr:S8 family peptidase [Deltaproteobacteria bacterium]